MSYTSTYLNFSTHTEEAFHFYRSVFGGEFEGPIARFGDAPPHEGMPPLAESEKNLILHICLPILGGHHLMGTDAPPSMGFSVNPGNNVHISLHPDSREEADTLFSRLMEGGIIEMPLQDMFWGAYYGSGRDKYGVQWMVNFEEKLYTLKNRFWTTTQEKRINRKQFIVRMSLLLLCIAVSIFSILEIFGYFMPDVGPEIAIAVDRIYKKPFLLSVVLVAIIAHIGYSISNTLFTKRFADFGHTNKIPRIILSTVFYGSCISYYFVGFSFLFDFGTWYHEFLLSEVSNILFSIIFYPVFIAFFSYIPILLIGAIKSGTKGLNAFGEEPKTGSIF